MADDIHSIGPSAVRLTKVEEKARALAGDETVDALLSMGPDELRERIVTITQHERETEDAKEKDEKLNDLKEQVKLAKAPYDDTLKSVKVQRTLISMLLEQKGKA